MRRATGLELLFQTVERAALRIESRAYTDLADERDEFDAFLRGALPPSYEWEDDEWTLLVARHAAAGRRFRRVRVMDDPLTDYNRFMIYTGARNTAAGEDIRYLTRVQANALDLPDHDFWVFDSAQVAELRFTADGRFLGHDLLEDAGAVSRHEAWFERAFAEAMTSSDYIAEDPSRAWPPARAGAAKGA